MHIIIVLLLILVADAAGVRVTSSTPSVMASIKDTTLTGTPLNGRRISPGSTPQDTTIVPLGDFPEHIMCHVGRFYSAHRAALERGIKYLNHFKDDDWILLDPGPGDEACSRVSCSSYSGIYVCNDNPHPVFVELRTVANFTRQILNNEDCLDPTSYKENSQGQAFSSLGWNVIAGMHVGSGGC